MTTMRRAPWFVAYEQSPLGRKAAENPKPQYAARVHPQFCCRGRAT